MPTKQNGEHSPALLPCQCRCSSNDHVHRFLNGFWDQAGKDAENIWKWVHIAVEIDKRKKVTHSPLLLHRSATSGRRRRAMRALQ
jgi:hypothetical protein